MRLRPPKAWCAFVAAAILAAGGCKPAEGPSTPQEPGAPVASGATPALPGARQDLPEEQRTPDLFGAWRVESVAAPDRRIHYDSMPMLLLVGNRELQILSQCITIGPFDYARTPGGGIAISQAVVTPRPPGSDVAPAPVQCARALSPAEGTLGPLLLTARTVKPEADGGVVVAGSAGAMTIRRLGVLPNPGGEAPPPRVPPLLGAWRVLVIDGRRLNEYSQRMELLLRPAHIEWRSGCINSTKTLTLDGATLIPGEAEPFPVCERGRTEAEDAMSRLLDRPIAARMEHDGGLGLSGSGVAAELAPLDR